MELEQLTANIEAVLFASDRPVSILRLKEVFGEEVPEELIVAGLEAIRERTQAPTIGVELREAQGGFQFCTKASTADVIRKFLATKPLRLSRSALETLAIIAYKQPVTRAEIDHIRGIDSSHLVRLLSERNLVRMAGKAEIPGRPVQYGTAPRFLEIIGLNALTELPPLSELEQLQGHTEDAEKNMEDGLDRFISDKSTQAAGDQFEEDQKGLEAIDEVLSSVGRTDREVYESPLHAEIAQENELAVTEFQAFSKEQKKQWKKAAKQAVATDASGGMIQELELEAEPASPDSIELQVDAAAIEVLAPEVPISDEAIDPIEIPQILDSVLDIEPDPKPTPETDVISPDTLADSADKLKELDVLLDSVSEIEVEPIGPDTPEHNA